MKFYNQLHKYYCGADLHARKMYVCILNHRGKVVVHQNIKTDPELFFELIFPFIEDAVVGVECVFCWYWLAGSLRRPSYRLCPRTWLYMKAIHGGKTKTIKSILTKSPCCSKGSNFLTAYPYPANGGPAALVAQVHVYLQAMQRTVAYINNTNTQYNLPAFRKLSRKIQTMTVWQNVLTIR